MRKNQLACLLLAQGMPLMLAGDEVGNSQNGNNNAYCQDNETGWVGWENLGKEGDDLTDFIGHMTELRRRFPQLRSQRWLDGRRAGRLLRRVVADAGRRGDEGSRTGIFRKAGFSPMCSDRWNKGRPPIFIVLNAAPEEIAFKLPKMPEYKNWQQVLNTTEAEQTSAEFASGAETKAPPRSVLAFAGSA